MQIVMKKTDAVQAFKNKVGVATAIGITKQAVSLWGEIVPEGSALKLLKLKPEIPHTQTNSKVA
jgi:DNA-binding transcriptional regulator YiaG